jgi:class 3 adenylate cyclase/predicted ATPase/DNA-binding CsgD family transcriptional regulator
VGSLPQGTVTFLFTDIEGSTRLLERLGRDPYGELLTAHRALLRGAVLAHGGAEVDEQGDSTLAVFASAGAAVAAAVEAQRSLASHEWPVGVAVRVRIGLHSGEAKLSGGAYVGLAVHRGRRVCDAAHGGQTLVSSATRSIVADGLPADVKLVDRGEVRLAGLDEPDRLFQLVGEGLPEVAADPRAPRPWREPERVLLERAEELAAVDAALAATLVGGGRLVVIEGPAGIGKTSILVEARERAVASGFVVLQGRGSEMESAFSFGVVRQLFEAVLAQAPPAKREQLLAGAAAHAERLFGAGAPDAAAGADAAFALMHGLYWLALNLAESQPIALAIDDLQWADEPSLRWLAYLARRIENAPVVVLATLRPVEGEDPQLTELIVDPATALLRPNALSAAGVTDFVRTELSAEAEDEFCAACHRATGGNPLLLRELLRTLAAENVSPVRSSIDVVERVAPNAVARSVRLRLTRLPSAAARLARAVSVLGDGAERETAAALAELERHEVSPAAATLVRVDLLRAEPPFRFVHPLVRNAVYESIPADERDLAHARAAATLREAGASSAQVAAQLLRAVPSSVEDARATLREAAALASSEGALESAARYLTRALDEPASDEQRAELLLELAAAETSLGIPAVISHLREAATLSQDERRRAETALALGNALYWAGEEEHGVEVLERALEEFGDLDLPLRHRLEAELVVNATRVPSQYEKARRRLEAISVSADEGEGARVLLSGQAYHEAAGGGDAEQTARRALEALTAMSDEERARNYVAGAYALLYTDRLEAGEQLLSSALAEARRRGAAFHFSSLSMTRAIFQYARGALVEAEADGRAAIDALPHHNVHFASPAHSWLAQILLERAMIDEAARLLETADGLVGPATNPFSQTPRLRAHAMLAAIRGDHRAALEYALELARTLTSFGHVNPPASYPAWRTLAALQHHALGETDQALALAREEVQLARSWGAPRTLGRALRIQGLIEGGEEGIDAIREAVAVLELSPARLEHAYALENLGGALRRGNQRAEAREHLRESLELAQRLGANLLSGEAHKELIATGARPRRIVRSGAAALTPSERRIAAMAAEGMSNREIAQALFVTLRTVEMHLSNAFRKLDVSSRTQLPAALAESEAAVAAGA